MPEGPEVTPIPRALVSLESADVQTMRDAREEVKAAMEEAKKAAPVFAGQVALIRVHSPCQIHLLVAQIWRTRLPKFIVVAANDAYLPGRVNFSARSRPARAASARATIKLPAAACPSPAGTRCCPRWGSRLTCLHKDNGIPVANKWASRGFEGVPP